MQGTEPRNASNVERTSHRTGGLILVACYAAVVFLMWGFQPAQETFDSYRYLGDWGWNPVMIFDALNGGFATSLLYVMAPEPILISFFQVFLSCLAWSLLALAILYRLQRTWVAWVLAITTLTLSLQSIFWSSHFAIASESLAFSATVTWLASIVWLASRSGSAVGPLIAITAALGLIAATRPQAMLALIPIQIVVLTWWARRENRQRTLVSAISALAPIAGFAAYRVWQVSQHDRWPFRYALHNLVDKEPSFRIYALERMPACDGIDNALAGPAPWNEVLALDNTMANLCPETFLWFQSDATSVWNWVPSIPGLALENFFDILPSISLIRWNEISLWPSSIDFALMPNSNPWAFSITCLIAGILLAWAAAVRPRITLLSVVGTMIAIASAFGYVFLVWAADGVDLGRHVFPILPLIGVAALVMPSVMPRRKTSYAGTFA
jgi:hypothetical protein